MLRNILALLLSCTLMFALFWLAAEENVSLCGKVEQVVHNMPRVQNGVTLVLDYDRAIQLPYKLRDTSVSVVGQSYQFTIFPDGKIKAVVPTPACQ